MSNKVINQTEAYVGFYLFISILSINNLRRNFRFSILYAYIINNLNKFYIYIWESSQNPRFHENLKIKPQEPQNHVGKPRYGVKTPAFSALANADDRRWAPGRCSVVALQLDEWAQPCFKKIPPYWAYPIPSSSLDEFVHVGNKGLSIFLVSFIMKHFLMKSFNFWGSLTHK